MLNKRGDGMELRLLKYFLMVAREEGITRAADILHITQPTLSRQLAQLEEDVGTQLIVRGPKKITLTSEGMLFKRRAEEILALVDKTRAELKSTDDIDGTITVGCGGLAASFTLADLVTSFRAKYPRVTFDIVTATADMVREQMENGLIDIGVLLEPINIESFDFVRLEAAESYALTMRADDELAARESIRPRDLIGRNIILPRRLNVRSELGHWLGSALNKINVVATSNLNPNGAILVERGLGYSLCIKDAMPYTDKNIIVERPLDPPLTASSVFAWKRHPMQTLAVARFIEHIMASLDS